MASVEWSNLPPDVLSILAKILNTDVDILHLRSVCTSWRSSVHPRLRPSPFPLKVPPLFSNSILPDGGHYFLNHTIIYHLSPPKHGPNAGDPSQGWLIRVLEVSPNRFLLLAPLLSRTIEFAPGTVPNLLNLLDHRITEVCKCYSLSFLHGGSVDGHLSCIVKKVIVLSNCIVGCEFAVVVLYTDGDKTWTPIETKDYHVTDVILYSSGNCYAIDRKGVLVSFNYEFILTVVALPSLPECSIGSLNYLVEYKSDLYAVSKICVNTSTEEDEGTNEASLQIKVYKKCNNSWMRIRCLGNEMLLSSNDVSVGLSAEDFRGRGANCVYVAHTDNVALHIHGEGQGLHYGVFHLDGDTTSAQILVEGRTLYWPPPGWLKKIAQNSSQLQHQVGFLHM